VRKSLVAYAFVGLCFCLTAVVVGCNGSEGDDTGTGGAGDDGSSGGTSTIRGNISSFKTADASFESLITENRSLLARFGSEISQALMPCAHAAGNRAGIIVYLDGPASRSTTTADDGSFVFSDLPAGEYSLSFEYDGEEVTYRGNSGQIATITVDENQVVELLNLKISGGKVNIGNIKVTQFDNGQDGSD
jgi:hypothetical protein